MFKLAVDAQLPLLKVVTRDTLNFPDVMKSLSGKTAVHYSTTKPPELKPNTLYYRVNEDCRKLDIAGMYKAFVEKESTLVFINPQYDHELLHDVGVLPVPKDFLMKTLGVFLDDTEINKLMPCFGGLTLHEIGEVVRLTQARDGTLTPQGINLTRKLTIKAEKGLSLVDTTMPMYSVHPELHEYATKNKKFFLSDTMDFRVVPKGVMFDGMPGTGKSQGAKYMANEWGVPLFRLDGTVQSKYVGESENNLARALAQLDNEAPCILLIDEIEKFFSTSSSADSSGVSQRLMGTLLWWLQEHRSKVFVVMTCNNKKVLPPELYREGRVDKVITFRGLGVAEAKIFANSVLATFKVNVEEEKNLLADKVSSLYDTEVTERSHAYITQVVHEYVKEFLA